MMGLTCSHCGAFAGHTFDCSRPDRPAAPKIESAEAPGAVTLGVAALEALLGQIDFLTTAETQSERA